jgi:fido (protein-threonine AMPylation protein)
MRCKIVDNRLAELAHRDSGRTRSVAELQKMATGILECHGKAKSEIESGHVAYPTNSDEFVSLIEHLHSKIFGATGLAFAGRIRTKPVFFGGNGADKRSGAPAAAIKAELAKLFRTDFYLSELLKTCDERTFLRFCARFLEAFFMIHPFDDGNGRIARLFLHLFAQQTGRFRFRSFLKDKDSKKKYVKALAFAHRHCLTQLPGDSHRERRQDPYSLLEIWLRNHLDQNPIDAMAEDQKPPWISDV